MGAAVAPAAAQVGAGAAGGSFLGPAGAIAGAIGGGISAFGTYEGMEAQSRNAAFQAQVAANNSQIARQNASLEFQSGEQQTANAEMELRSQLGTEKAGQAASGVDVNSKSLADARAGTAEIGTVNALNIRSNAARKAYGYETEATGDTAESQLLESESKEASGMAPIAATGSMLSSASTVGSQYQQYLRQS
jgi:hypothetical protein